MAAVFAVVFNIAAFDPPAGEHGVLARPLRAAQPIPHGVGGGTEITMLATAYTYEPGHHNITFGGLYADTGVVAVDPSVIPLGALLWIEGYGYATAGDTGGLIKGRRVDLFMRTKAEAVQYGIRQVRVIVVRLPGESL